MASTAAVLNILVNAQTGKAQAELTALDSRLKKTAATGSATSGVFGGKFNKGLVAGAAGFAAVGVAAAAAGKELYNVGKELDEAYDTIRTGTGATGKQLEKLKRDFRSVARTVPNDFQETGTAIADLNTRLGLSGRPLRSMSRQMLNLSRITKSDLEGNIKSVARAFVDWEVPVKRQTKTLDGFYRLSQASGQSVSEIASNIQDFGSPLRTLGKDIGYGAALFAQFERAGVNMQTTLPGLKQFIGNLAKPTEELADQMKQLGIDANDPAEAFDRTLKLVGPGSKLTEGMKKSFAVAIFGKRAYADMLEAIKQGRFDVDAFVKTFERGRETINKSARDTNDAGENMAIFWNNLKITVAPAADAVYNAVSKLSLILAELPLQKATSDVRRFFKSNEDLRDVLKVTGVALRVFGMVAGEVWKVVREQVRGFVQYFKGAFEVLRGIVRVFSRVLRGDFKGAWDAVKDIFRGSVDVVVGVMRAMTAPVRAVTAKIAGVLKGVFASAWEGVKKIFVGGANAVVDVVNAVIDVINKIPGVPDIGKVGKIGGATRNVYSPSGQGLPQGRQRGGMLFGGKPSGDSIPAMLERGEYVLNRNAVGKIGRKQLDAVNFGHAPRFQEGGPVGMLGGGIADAIGGAASSVAGAASGLAGKALGVGANWFIKRLPKPNFPAPFAGLGPWLIEHVTDWIKGHAPAAGGSLGTLPGSLGKAMELAQRMGLTITSTTGGEHAPNSYHYQGRAFDASNGVDTPEMRGYFMAAASKWGSKILELFYDPIGWYIKNGSKVAGAIGGHSDHVHTAMQLGGPVGMMRGGAAEHSVVRRVGRFLLNRGFNFRATAGVLGNAWREGLWNPSQMEYTGLDNGGLFGFTTSPVSLADVRAFAERRGKRWDDPILQTNFMLSHGQPTGMALRGAMNAANAIPKATEIFMSQWEKPGVPALDERVAAAFDASSILRNAGIVRAGADGKDKGLSDREKAVRAAKGRRDARLRQARQMVRKGQYWRLFDLFANYGDFERHASRFGGVGPGMDEARSFLSRVGSAASVVAPGKRLGRLGEVARWLMGAVDLTGAEDGNDRLAGRLSGVKEKSASRAARRRAKRLARMARFGTDSPWGKPLNENAARIALLAERIGLAEREHSADWSAGGSEYTDGEVANEVGLNRRKLTAENRRYRMFTAAIPYFRSAADRYRRLIDGAGPRDRWKVPGWRKGLKGATANLKAARAGLTSLVGLTGDGGTRGDTFYRLRELGVTDTVEKQAAANANAGISISDVLQIVEASKYNVFGRMPKFHSGGIVGGQGEVPIVARAGEGVFTPGQMAAMGRPEVHVHFDDGMGWLKQFMRVEIKENDRVRESRAKAGVR